MIVEALENGEVTSEFEQSYPSQFYEVQEALEDSRINVNDPNPRKKQRRDKAVQKIEKIKNRTIRVNELVHLMNTDECAPLIKSFIKLGVNPGGPSIHLQNIPRTNTPWYSMFDFETGTWTNDNPEFQDEIKRSEEHTSELQSRPHLVCRLLLEKKNKISIK